ncbi:transposase [Streptomyces mirabilis]|uniref:transposase n=1 Tax=Streptomyces mirabilis TaxID=68239 RepID=UPI00368646A8
MVRTLAYRLKDQVGEGPADGYRLVTTLLDTGRDHARQLAVLYRERWEIESVFAEIKTQQQNLPRLSAGDAVGVRRASGTPVPDGIPFSDSHSSFIASSSPRLVRPGTTPYG